MLLNSTKYDIIFVTEMWLHSDFPDFLFLSNYVYTIFRKDRGDGYGVGVAIFVKNSLKAVFVDLDPVFLSLECIVLDLLVRGYHVFIYKPPSLANDVGHTACICSLLDTYTKGCVFYVGDFNYPHINWKIPSSHGSVAQNNF